MLVKTLDYLFVDDKAGKPVGIHQFIGRRPIACFGNSDGDQAMLQYTTLLRQRGPIRRNNAMTRWHKQLLSALAATSLMLGTGPVATAVGAAEEAVLIPGATVFKRINPIYPICRHHVPGDRDPLSRHDANLHLVDYSQNALDSDRAILDGVKQASIVVNQTTGKVVIIGESMGSMVAWRVAAELANSDDPPSTEDVRVVLIAPPEAGVAEYFKEGTYIPILNYRVTRIAESPYDTTIVIGEYDGWSDPPDRPWNLVSSANALAGIAYVHGPPIFTSDPACRENTTVVPANGQHGTITTILSRPRTSL